MKRILLTISLFYFLCSLAYAQEILTNMGQLTNTIQTGPKTILPEEPKTDAKPKYKEIPKHVNKYNKEERRHTKMNVGEFDRKAFKYTKESIKHRYNKNEHTKMQRDKDDKEDLRYKNLRSDNRYDQPPS